MPILISWECRLTSAATPAPVHAERLVEEVRSGVTCDTHPSELTSQQIVRLHELLHAARFSDPKVGGRGAPTGAAGKGCAAQAQAAAGRQGWAARAQAAAGRQGWAAGRWGAPLQGLAPLVGAGITHCCMLCTVRAQGGMPPAPLVTRASWVPPAPAPFFTSVASHLLPPSAPPCPHLLPPWPLWPCCPPHRGRT